MEQSLLRQLASFLRLLVSQLKGTCMKDVLEYIIKNLVKNKDKVLIKEEKEGNFVKYIVEVDRDDFGKVIGHEGKIAKDIRTIMGAIATIKDVKVAIDIR